MRECVFHIGSVSYLSVSALGGGMDGWMLRLTVPLFLHYEWV